jgi:drug/metabolite transporter (DMT)-like permease
VFKLFFTRSLKLSPHLAAILQALFVTFLWSTSWVLIKFGLENIPALTFAGLRYILAFLCLLPFVFKPANVRPLRQLAKPAWSRLILLGFLFYTLTQGAQFLALAYLPAMTASLLLNFTTVAVALLGIILLAEWPKLWQWGGVLINIAGILLYFYPVNLPAGQVFGLFIAAVGILANAGSAILGRSVNRAGDISPLTVTAVSMGIGAILLLITGIIVQGFPTLNFSSWLIVGWLAVINTAFAFTWWNASLRLLSAVESSIINSTMLIQIALLAWLFLGEQLSWQEIAGMVLAGVGVLIVQLKR